MERRVELGHGRRRIGKFQHQSCPLGMVGFTAARHEPSVTARGRRVSLTSVRATGVTSSTRGRGSCRGARTQAPPTTHA